MGVFKGMGLCHDQLHKRVSKTRTDQEFVQVLIVQSPGFQDPIVEVHPMGILFDP